MTLQPDLTGQDRVAEIVMTCVDTVRIRVEQKGTNADGKKLEGTEKQFVDNIIFKWEDSKDDLRQMIMEFTYNSDGTEEIETGELALNADGYVVEANSETNMTYTINYKLKNYEKFLLLFHTAGISAVRGV